MKIQLLILLICTMFMSCNNKVHFKQFGEFKFSGDFTSTINGKPSYKEPQALRSSFKQFLNICSDQPMDEESFIEDCILLRKKDLEEIKKILEVNDLILTTRPLKKILKKSEYTKRDGCDYWSLKIVELVLDKESKEEGVIYIYKIAPKNSYRLNLCP